MYDAIVLAGGSGRRLGGVDKGSLDVGGQTLLQRVLTAVAGAGRTVVVGPARDLPAGVLSTCEQPPGGGPVAGLAAGLAMVEAPLVAVLACDLPFVTATTIRSLVDMLTQEGATPGDGAQLVDEEGREQPLAAVYRTPALRTALSALAAVANTPMRHVTTRLRMLDVGADSGQASDCDTWADLNRARERGDRLFLEEQ